MSALLYRITEVLYAGPANGKAVFSTRVVSAARQRATGAWDTHSDRDDVDPS
jgi:hypothetical protein